MLFGASPLGFVQDQLWAGLALGLVWDSASIGLISAWLEAQLGSARLRSGSIRFGLGRYSRLRSARLEDGLYWLEALLGMARGSVRLGSSIGPAQTRLEARELARDSVWL